MELRTVGIVGAEGIGAGIAQICVQAGLEVILVDDTEEILGAAEDRILRGLQRAEQPGAFSLMRKATRLDKLESCDLAIECGLEAPQAKQDLLRRMDSRVSRSCVLAVQTSALPVSIAARAVENPERVVGVHFFTPPTISRLVEVIRYEHASEEAMRTVLDFVARLGKTAVRCQDTAGFIVNRVSRPMFLCAMRLLERGRGDPVSIDSALRTAGAFPAGPFQLADFAGLEEDLSVSEILYELLGRPERLRPAEIERKLILRGCRGRRDGAGFYAYRERGSASPNPALAELVDGYGADPAKPEEIVRAVREAVGTEARALVDAGVAAEADVESAMRLGMQWPKGPFFREEKV